MPKKTYSIETLQADSPFKVVQNLQIWKPRDKKWRHNVIFLCPRVSFFSTTSHFLRPRVSFYPFSEQMKKIRPRINRSLKMGSWVDKKFQKCDLEQKKTLKMSPKIFTPKLNLFKIFCPRFQIAFQFYGQTITSNIVFKQITFFLPNNNHLD